MPLEKRKDIKPYQLLQDPAGVGVGVPRGGGWIGLRSFGFRSSDHLRSDLPGEGAGWLPVRFPGDMADGPLFESFGGCT